METHRDTVRYEGENEVVHIDQMLLFDMDKLWSKNDRRRGYKVY